MNKKFALIIVFMLVITTIPVIQPSLAKISINKSANAFISIRNIINKPYDRHIFVTDLIADDIYIVGNVSVWNENDTIFVKYLTMGEWKISETYLHIDCDLCNIPQEDGNPIPYYFDYHSKHDPVVTEYTHTILRSYRCNFSWPMKVAAYALVCKEEIVGGLDYVNNNLPEQATVKAVHATTIPPYNQGYFKITVTGDEFIGGVYNGWCVDLDINMIDNKTFTANVYSSYEILPDGMLEKPWNLDLVNYILNQHYVGKPSCCGGIYTYGDVQRAIWELIEDQQSTTYLLGPWSQCRVDEILCAANAYGEGFTPACGQIVAIILQPINKVDGQICIIEFLIDCEEVKIYKPAWGDGYDFPGDDWATYFKYIIHY